MKLSTLVVLLCLFTLPAAAQIEWLSWEEAVERNKTEPRKFLVDVYTDWCGWCKKMDKSTFVDPKVAAYVQQNYYAVKFNAEQRGPIKFAGHTLTFDATAGRRGAHQLAIALLDGRMSYPSIVYMDEEISRITISPGFKAADSILKELRFVAGEYYDRMTYEEYLKTVETSKR